MSQPRPLIFVTGATGFIGAHAFTQALDAEYRVRLSVRKESQIESLKSVAGKHLSNVEFVVIPDLAVPGAFDKALQGATHVFHVASPMPGTGTDFKTTYLAPALNGTMELLNAAKRVDTIQRVIIVSSSVTFITHDEFTSGVFDAIGKFLTFLNIFTHSILCKQ